MGDIGEPMKIETCQKDGRFGANRFDPGSIDPNSFLLPENDEDQETNPADDRSYDTTTASSDPRSVSRRDKFGEDLLGAGSDVPTFTWEPGTMNGVKGTYNAAEALAAGCDVPSFEATPGTLSCVKSNSCNNAHFGYGYPWPLHMMGGGSWDPHQQGGPPMPSDCSPGLGAEDDMAVWRESYKDYCNQMAVMAQWQASQFQYMAQAMAPQPQEGSQPRPQGKGRGAAKQASPTAQAEPAAQADAVPEHLRTTVMLKNVPPNYNRTKLLKLLDDKGFYTLYDFVYLPFDFKKTTRLGYAFVNMIDHASAVRFMTEFEGLSDWKDETPNAESAQTRWGKIHCKTGHINRYRDSPLMHPNVPDEYKPMVFENGVQFPFPLPTNAKRMQLPRAVKAGQPVRKDPAVSAEASSGSAAASAAEAVFAAAAYTPPSK